MMQAGRSKYFVSATCVVMHRFRCSGRVVRLARVIDLTPLEVAELGALPTVRLTLVPVAQRMYGAAPAPAPAPASAAAIAPVIGTPSDSDTPSSSVGSTVTTEASPGAAHNLPTAPETAAVATPTVVEPTDGGGDGEAPGPRDGAQAPSDTLEHDGQEDA